MRSSHPIIQIIFSLGQAFGLTEQLIQHLTHLLELQNYRKKYIKHTHTLIYEIGSGKIRQTELCYHHTVITMSKLVIISEIKSFVSVLFLYYEDYSVAKCIDNTQSVL